MRVSLGQDRTEPTIALQLVGRKYDALIDTGFSGLLIAYAYPDHLYDETTFLNNVKFEKPISLLPESQWAVVADARPVQTWISSVPVRIGAKYHSLQFKVIFAEERQKQDLIIEMMFLRDYRRHLCLDFKRCQFHLK